MKGNEKAVLNPFGFPVLCRVLIPVPVQIPASKEDLNKSKAKAARNYPPHFTGAKVQSEPKYYLEAIAKQMNLSLNDTVLVLKSMSAVSPGALLNLLLMAVAKELDKAYDNHISECPDVYCYSTTDSKIFRTATDHIKKASFIYFAAFRSNNEAVFGIRMANAIRNLIFTDARK